MFPKIDSSSYEINSFLRETDAYFQNEAAQTAAEIYWRARQINVENPGMHQSLPNGHPSLQNEQYQRIEPCEKRIDDDSKFQDNFPQEKEDRRESPSKVEVVTYRTAKVHKPHCRLYVPPKEEKNVFEFPGQKVLSPNQMERGGLYRIDSGIGSQEGSLAKKTCLLHSTLSEAGTQTDVEKREQGTQAPTARPNDEKTEDDVISCRTNSGSVKRKGSNRQIYRASILSARSRHSWSSKNEHHSRISSPISLLSVCSQHEETNPSEAGDSGLEQLKDQVADYASLMAHKVEEESSRKILKSPNSTYSSSEVHAIKSLHKLQNHSLDVIEKQIHRFISILKMTTSLTGLQLKSEAVQP